jgi:hypothetical protein
MVILITKLLMYIWEQVLNFVSLNSSLPMFCMGDLNELMNINEKLGPTNADVNRINNLCAYVKQCGFIDLGYSGPAYTWTNKSFSSVPTYERLDRCLGNAEWCLAFPATTIYHLPMMYSNHAPILAVLNSSRPRIINLSGLKIGGYRIMNTMILPKKKVGVAHLTKISLKKQSFLLQILGNGEKRNQETMIY